jgi:uncharacterized protein (TIGR03382 family)
MSKYFPLVTVLVCAALARTTLAAAAYDFEDRKARVATSGAIDRTFGWEFTVNQPIIVTHLGYFDAGNTQPTNPPDGLFLAHPVGLWNTAGNLLTSGTVQSGTTSPEFQSYRYADVPDITLNPGQSYIVAAFSPTGEYQQHTFDPFPDFASDWIFLLPDGTFEVRQPVVDYAPQVTLVQSRYVLFNTTMTFPSNTLAGDAGVGGANFQFTVIPEPASASCLLVLGFSVLGRRRR